MSLSPKQRKVQDYLDSLVNRRVNFRRHFDVTARIQLPTLPPSEEQLERYLGIRARSSSVQSVTYWHLRYDGIEQNEGFWQAAEKALGIAIDWIAGTITMQPPSQAWTFRRGDYLVQVPSGALQLWSKEEFESQRRF